MLRFSTVLLFFCIIFEYFEQHFKLQSRNMRLSLIKQATQEFNSKPNPADSVISYGKDWVWNGK